MTNKDNVVRLPTAKTSRTVHEVPEDFNPETGLYLNNEEHSEAYEAALICDSLLRMLRERYQFKACSRDDRNNPEDWQDVANVVTAAQGQLKRIEDLLGK